MDPWSKVDYSRHIREASMGVDGLPEVVPPSGRVPGQLLLAAPSLKRRWRYRDGNGKKNSVLGVSSAGAIYRRRGQPGGPSGSQAPPWRPLALGRATRAPGAMVCPLLPSFGDSGRFLCADFLYKFSRIFGALLIVGKPEIQKQQK